jgi:hypothetical protein
LAHFGLFVAHFWLILAHFCHILAHFCHILAHVGNCFKKAEIKVVTLIKLYYGNNGKFEFGYNGKNAKNIKYFQALIFLSILCNNPLFYIVAIIIFSNYLSVLIQI